MHALPPRGATPGPPRSGSRRGPGVAPGPPRGGPVGRTAWVGTSRPGPPQGGARGPLACGSRGPPWGGPGPEGGTGVVATAGRGRGRGARDGVPRRRSACGPAAAVGPPGGPVPTACRALPWTFAGGAGTWDSLPLGGSVPSPYPFRVEPVLRAPGRGGRGGLRGTGRGGDPNPRGRRRRGACPRPRGRPWGRLGTELP